MDEFLNKIVKSVSDIDKRMIIGISGHGASGKTTLAHRLITLFGKEHVNYINTDPYIIKSSRIRKYALIDYEYEGVKYRYKMTACHPGAHNISALERDIRMIREGLELYTIATDYTESEFISSEKKINIIEGMSVAFTDPELYDFKIYLYTDDETELMWRSSRDVEERGSNLDFVRQSHEQRRIQYRLLMHHYHQNFDVVIKNSNKGYVLGKERGIKR